MTKEQNTSNEASGREGPGTTPGPDGATVEMDQSLGSLDDLLAIEDPEFAATLDELKKPSETDAPEIEIDSIDIEEALKTAPDNMGWRSWPMRLRSYFSLKSLLSFGKRTAQSSLFHLKSLLKSFFALPRSSKLLLVAVLFFGGLSAFTIRLALTGKFLPSLRTEYLTSFSEVSDQAFTYGPDEPFDDLMDPLLHPEHAVEFNKLVVNLRGSKPGQNSMGLFEFYIQLSTQAGAVEAKDREVEVRDLISRTIEQMTYEDLVTAQGKDKLKILMRKNLNLLFTKGRVLRVYLKTVVLKP